jgi:hypothetical protein
MILNILDIHMSFSVLQRTTWPPLHTWLCSGPGRYLADVQRRWELHLQVGDSKAPWNFGNTTYTHGRLLSPRTGPIFVLNRSQDIKSSYIYLIRIWKRTSHCSYWGLGHPTYGNLYQNYLSAYNLKITYVYFYIKCSTINLKNWRLRMLFVPFQLLKMWTCFPPDMSGTRQCCCCKIENRKQMIRTSSVTSSERQHTVFLYIV